MRGSEDSLMTKLVIDDAFEASRLRTSSGLQAKPNAIMFRAICVSMLGAIMFGLDQGNFGNVQGFKSFQHQWCTGSYDLEGNSLSCSIDAEHNTHWQDDFVRWGASLITFGAAAGGLLLGPVVANRFGRRPCISTGAALCFLGCLFASYWSLGSITIFMVGRFLTGFGIGVCCFALPLYNAEMATPGVRGTTGSLFQLNVVVGCFIATLVTLVNADWKLGMVLPGIAGAFVAVAVWFTPESPRFVMGRAGYEAGMAILQQVRDGDVAEEGKEMHAQILAEAELKQTSYYDLFNEASSRKRVLIACWLQIAQQLTGVNAFLGYAFTLFKTLGISDPLWFNLIWNSIMILGCIVGLVLVDSSFGGRRIQLLIATALMGPSLTVAGLALALSWPGVLTMIMICIYGVGFQIAWGTIPWIYPSEIFTMAEKEKAVSLAVFLQYAFNAFIIVITPRIMSYCTSCTLFAFAVLNVSNFVFVFSFVKETKGVPLEEIPALFGAIPLLCKNDAGYHKL